MASPHSCSHAGSDHELLIANFRFKLKKVGKTTRLFQYDLNQILSDYMIQVDSSRFKGLCLVDRVPEELWMEFHNMVQEAVTNTFPKRAVGNTRRQCGCLGRF